MTIHSDWSRVLKEECPEAYTPKLPDDANVNVGIVDGHIQLMGGCYVRTWMEFIEKQYLRPVREFYRCGCKVAVVNFDNSLVVPPYKCMTQTKRRAKFKDVSFGPSDPLPHEIPEDWMAFMMNPYFKMRVISYVCEKLPSLVDTSSEGRKLIIDYRGHPKLYSDGEPCPTEIRDFQPLGEADVKFCRYVHRFGNAMVWAVDGDYIPIALLYYAERGVTNKNHIYIYRQLSTLKRFNGDTEGTVSESKGKRQMEYLSVHLIYHVILSAFRQSGSRHIAILRGNEQMKPTDGDVIRIAVNLMLLAGTDYSKPLPMVGPKRIWDQLPNFIHQLFGCYDFETKRLDPVRVSNLLVSRIYSLVYEKHLQCVTNRSDIEHVMKCLQRSKLSDRVKSILPSANEVHTTSRNVLWVMHYWGECLNKGPDTTQSELFGFFKNGNNKYCWAFSIGMLPPTNMSFIHLILCYRQVHCGSLHS